MIRSGGLACVLVGLAAGIAVGTPALAADAFVAQTSPNVMINSGGGFAQSRILEEVRAGDQVMANEGGSGWIIYCGCDVEIMPGKVYTVENRECKVESVRLREPGLPHIVAYPDGERGEQEIRRCRRGAAFLLGAGIAVGFCAAADCFGDDDDRPASP